TTAAPAAVTAPAAAPAGEAADRAGPAVRRQAAEQGVNLEEVAPTGKGGRVTREDVERHLERAPQPPPAAPASASGQVAPAGREERVKMTRLRMKIAERLVQAQQTAAMLTTFNEVDMSQVMELRNRYRDETEKKYGTRLGFMSFFTKAAIEALKAFPAVNAEISGEEIVYKKYYDIGVAVSSERGLVVPVVRDADRKRFIEIEQEILALARKARENKLSVDELSGGTFTITNGGVFGSMLSTPIINPPQVAILGMHNIVQRAVVVNGEIVVRPMMYLALSYDHRIIDGREAVQFLVRIKQCIEDPARILLEL
ncbi:MAG: 2-oxoglutarate dehydrogenase complex dihydrolipoyllysine-residue succinyltransferase, partial [Deltaproteobacteria bacterium]|nr:2-oxoglutarate dehydrogenase complex dihydrolipoyllysine-residue succinyltransferase [Deltaproteobacteria bacterium]